MFVFRFRGATLALGLVLPLAAALPAPSRAGAAPVAVATEAEAPVPVVARAVVPAADFKLDDLAGQVVMLDFWASWCKPCKQSMPWLSALQRRYAEQGLQIVAISVDTDEAAMRARLGELDPGIIVVFDPKGELAAQYKLEGMPTTYLIGRDGKPRGSHIGYLEKEATKREAQIASLLEEGR